MKRWPTTPLGELISLEYGKALKAEERSGNGRYPVYGSNGIVGSHDEAVVKEPTIVVGRKGAIGEAHLAENGCWPIDTAFYTSFRQPGLVSLQYLLLWFRSVDLKSLAITATIPGLSRNTLYAQQIPVPPLPEQERIVTLLDEVDELGKLRAEADRRTADLIPALFNEMFGGATPANTRWPFKALGAVGKVVTGNTPSRKIAEYYGTFVEWVKTDNINALAGRVERAAEALSAEGAKCGRVVPAGSVLMTCIAGSRDRIGDAAVSDREVAINQQINAIIPNSESDATFLCELIRALKPEIQRRATGVMTGIINKSSLEQIESISPPLSVQKEFGSKVTEIRMMQADQAASGQHLDDLFQSMLYRAFSGAL